MSLTLSSLRKKFKKNLEGGEKNQKYGIIYTPVYQKSNFRYIKLNRAIDTNISVSSYKEQSRYKTDTN